MLGRQADVIQDVTQIQSELLHILDLHGLDLKQGVWFQTEPPGGREMISEAAVT